MNEMLAKTSNWKAPVSGVDVRSQQNAGVSPASLHELIHEVRQPLGVIECIAYYLELTSRDEKACAHVSRIRAMVSQVNGILERACASERKAAPEKVAC